MAQEEQLMDEFADKLSDALEKKKRLRPDRQDKPSAPKKRFPTPDLSAVYRASRSLVGSVSPEIGGLANLGESIADALKGSFRMMGLQEERRTNSSRSYTASSASEDLKKAAEKLEKVADKAEEKEKQENQELERKAQQRKQQIAQGRGQAYSGARGVVGTVSPEVGGLMDFGSQFKNMAAGLTKSMMTDEKAQQRKSDTKKAAEDLPTAQTAVSSMSSAQTEAIESQAAAALLGPYKFKKTEMSGVGDGENRAEAEATRELDEDETEIVENVPEEEQETEFDLENQRGEELSPTMESVRDVHRVGIEDRNKVGQLERQGRELMSLIMRFAGRGGMGRGARGAGGGRGGS